jgi:hypothetical protein
MVDSYIGSKLEFCNVSLWMEHMKQLQTFHRIEERRVRETQSASAVMFTRKQHKVRADVAAICIGGHGNQFHRNFVTSTLRSKGFALENIPVD